MHVDGRFRERATQVLATKSTGAATSALAVRLLDHVPQVREAAWVSLTPHLDAHSAEAVLDVVLAGRERQHAGKAIDGVQGALIARLGAECIVRTLVTSSRRNVRRWAYQLGHQWSLLTPDQLLDAACSDPDPWLRAQCADWLMDIGHAGHGSLLLESNSVEPRLVAVTRMPDDDLSDDRLQALVLDRASRVRERARWRAHRRGLDVVGCYRSQLGMSSRPPRLIAACLDGIAILGDESDLPPCIGHLGHSNARVRAAAVGAILARAANDDAVRLLAPCCWMRVLA